MPELDAASVPPIIGRVRNTSRRSPIASFRLTGYVGSDVAATETMMMTIPAPAHYDAVRITGYSDNAASRATQKISVAPSSRYNNGWQPLDAAGSNQAFTPVTFGTTDATNPRNPGGGASTGTQPAATGDTATNKNLIESQMSSDWVFVSSLARLDFPTKKPLLFIRGYGLEQAAVSLPPTITNGIANAISNVVPDFYCGYWSGDQTASIPGGAPTGGWMPGLRVDFLLRGTLCNNIALAGASLNQGYNPSNCVPYWGGRHNGWLRKACAILDQTVPTSYVDLCAPSQVTRLHYERAMNAVLLGNLTHLFYEGWCDNSPTTAAEGTQSIIWINNLIMACAAKGITFVGLRTFSQAGQGSAARVAVDAYWDNYAAVGGLVWNPGRLICNPSQVLNPTYYNLLADGVTPADIYHPNEAAHNISALDLVANRNVLGL